MNDIAKRASKYQWYHPIKLGDYVTPNSGFHVIWAHIRGELSTIDFKGKSVLDLGARDGMWSLQAEDGGATDVLAVDNDVSRGALEVALPFLKSAIVMEEGNIYDCVGGKYSNRDIVLMLGILYHLRFPMLGLFRASECLKADGLLVIESAMYTGEPQDRPMLYCPFLESPYEGGSPSFFNRNGLITVMGSMGMYLVKESDNRDTQVRDVRRMMFQFKKGEMLPHYREYWTNTHTAHSSETDAAWHESAARKAQR